MKCFRVFFPKLIWEAFQVSEVSNILFLAIFTYINRKVALNLMHAFLEIQIDFIEFLQNQKKKK